MVSEHFIQRDHCLDCSNTYQHGAAQYYVIVTMIIKSVYTETVALPGIYQPNWYYIQYIVSAFPPACLPCRCRELDTESMVCTIFDQLVKYWSTSLCVMLYSISAGP